MSIRIEDLSVDRVRTLIRKGEWTGPTVELARGFAQAGLAIVPERYALSFFTFCQRNPKPCSVLDVTEIGDPTPKLLAPRADVRTDLPKYRVFSHGKLVAEPTDIRSYWRDDSVAFLLGCSLTFETTLVTAGVPIRHLEEGKEPPIYVTNVPCTRAGPFGGPLVVSMRPIPHDMATKAVQITSRYPYTHGAPVHIGDPALIGIRDLGRPDFGQAVAVRPTDVPMFWACTVTPQAVAVEAKLELLITHAPNHMFITDRRHEDFTVA